MSCCVHLLDFYHEIGREELYVKYLKKLIALHEQCHNWAEAGFTVMQVNKLVHGLRCQLLDGYSNDDSV